MCGIGGKLYYDPGRPVEPAVMDRMKQALSHRGPDGEGVFCSGPVGLCHRRLAVIDLAMGRQPMSTADGRLWVTYNGEIYNFRELRDELTALGRRFRTQSDTEVILHAYAQWGEACVERLNGMFAFGLWDQGTRTLVLARDRLGIKPLFYYEGTGYLLFSSVIDGILSDPGVACRVDARGLSDYLSLGYTLAPNTLLQGIRKLPAGRVLRAANGAVTVRSYWDLASVVRAAGRREPPAGGTEAGLRGELAGRLGRAVESQLVSDVPLGAFLSGGLDSSTVVQQMAVRIGAPVRTFSVGFREASYSEARYARDVAAALKTRHEEVTLPADLSQAIPDIARRLGEPLGDSSCVPMFFVSQAARASVTVALSGDGGDEVFGGYETYLADRLHRHYVRIPRWLRRHVLEPLVRSTPTSFRKVSLDYKAKRFIAGGDQEPAEAHYTWRELFSEAEKRRLLPAALTEGLGGYRPSARFVEHFRDVDGADPLAQAQYVDIKTWLVDDILVKVDRSTMAHGLEARVPLLDHELVEFGLGLAGRWKIRGARTKYLLKRTMAPALPRHVTERSKSGFNAPVGPWLRGPLRGLFEDAVLDGPGTFVPLEQRELRGLLSDHLAGRGDHGYRLWSVLMLQLWARGVEAR